jgi:hypothetical protein
MSTGNFIGGYISLRKSAAFKNDNFTLVYFSVIALIVFMLNNSRA